MTLAVLGSRFGRGRDWLVLADEGGQAFEAEVCEGRDLRRCLLMSAQPSLPTCEMAVRAHNVAGCFSAHWRPMSASPLAVRSR